MQKSAVERHWWWLLGALMLLGFALRLASAQGALWLDEAWSALLAHQTGTVLGVFLKINHDNNHHFNSLWLQIVGMGAPPPLARALSIATGTLGILVAGLIGRRRDATLGLLTALLFAVSPILVTMGSEARGYAPMLLALLIAMLKTDRWLAGETIAAPRRALAWSFFLGAFCQFTILFGFCALAGWVGFALWRRSSPARAIAETLRLFAPSLIALGVVAAIVVIGAALDRNGFQFGSYDRFTWHDYLHGVTEMLGYTLGAPPSPWLLALPLAALALATVLNTSRPALYALAILGFPLALALLRAGNVAYGRYYLVAAIALLLLLADLIWLAIGRGGIARWLAIAILGATLSGSMAFDLDLLRNQRGDPGTAIDAMQRTAPSGTSVIAGSISQATLRVAAAERHYPLIVIEDHRCAAEPYLFVDRDRGTPFPRTVLRCGHRYALIAYTQAHGLSGTDWTLYALQH